MVAFLLQQFRIVLPVVVVLLFAPSASAVKDDSYYSANSGNPNMDLPMYWKDSENVLQDLSQFSSLYVEFHGCVWSWMKFPGAVDDGNSGSGDYANDYWYTESVPPMGANVAFSLYGALAGEKFEGCNRNSFINSFYTDFGFTDFARAMSHTGMSGFKGYTANINSDDDYYSSSGTTAQCQGGYGVGCDSRYGFAMHTYSTDECNPEYYSGVSDTLSTLNTAMNKAKCVRIYDSSNFAGFDYIYGTPLELLTYSTACNYMNQERPDGSCPDPYGKIAYYINTFNKGIMKKREDPWETYHATVDRDLKMVVTGAALLAASVVIMFIEMCRKSREGKGWCCYTPLDEKKEKEGDDDNDDAVTLTTDKDFVKPEESNLPSENSPVPKDTTQNLGWLGTIRAVVQTKPQPGATKTSDVHTIKETSSKVPEVGSVSASNVDGGTESSEPVVTTPYHSMGNDNDKGAAVEVAAVMDSMQIRQMLLDKLARHQAEQKARLEVPVVTTPDMRHDKNKNNKPAAGKNANATKVGAAGRSTNINTSIKKNVGKEGTGRVVPSTYKPPLQMSHKKQTSMEAPSITGPALEAPSITGPAQEAPSITRSGIGPVKNYIKPNDNKNANSTTPVEETSKPPVLMTPNQNQSHTSKNDIIKTYDDNKGAASPVAPSRAISPLASRPISPLASRPISPLVSHAISPSRSRAISPLASRAISPLASRAISPTASRTISPTASSAISRLTSRAISAPPSRTKSPLASRAISPLASRTISPLASRTISPTASSDISSLASRAVSPVVSSTISPSASRAISPLTSGTSLPSAIRSISPSSARPISPLQMRDVVLEAIERRRQVQEQTDQLGVPVTTTTTTPSMGHDSNNEPTDANKVTTTGVSIKPPVIAASSLPYSGDSDNNSINSSASNSTTTPRTTSTLAKSKIEAGNRFASSVPTNFTPPTRPLSPSEQRSQYYSMGKAGKPVPYQSSRTQAKSPTPPPPMDGPPPI